MLDKFPIIKTINTFPKKTRIAMRLMLISAGIVFLFGLATIVFGGFLDSRNLLDRYDLLSRRIR